MGLNAYIYQNILNIQGIKLVKFGFYCYNTTKQLIKFKMEESLIKWKLKQIDLKYLHVLATLCQLFPDISMRLEII